MLRISLISFVTPKELNNREIIDGIWNDFLGRKLDLPLNFKFKFFTARESNDRQTFEPGGWIQSNFKLVSAKHWKYQTPNEWTSASVNFCL